eukprot:TRINITY_DN719_c0_g1_i13.p1 TRINITY_DN719_c0_g1~~TRINITY_DN719_c0_g1_i13.p1  ORF type:complete len:434 (-),score=76.36 TRINITY_DN719_c0_g1_i13:153-1430(-)
MCIRDSYNKYGVKIEINNNNGGQHGQKGRGLQYQNNSNKQGNPQKSGQLASYPLVITLILSMKNSFFFYLFGISYEQLVFWHKVYGLFSLISGLMHAITSNKVNSGYYVIAPIIVLNVLAIYPIRKYIYQLFSKSHWISVGVLVLGCITHKVTLGLIGLAFVGADCLIKLLLSIYYYQKMDDVTIQAVSEKIVKLQFKNKNFKFDPSQYYNFYIPKVSLYELHPFSVASSCHDNYVTFYIKVLGNWTQGLHKLAQKQRSALVFMHGPYGTNKLDLFNSKYESFVFVSGGIGLPPMLSNLKSILYQRSAGRNIKKIIFVWTTRDATDAAIVEKQQILDMLSKEDQQNKLVDFELYLTGNTSAYQNDDIGFHKGRLDLSQIIQGKFQQKEKIALMGCGQASLINAIRNSIHFLKKNQYFIDYDFKSY